MNPYRRISFRPIVAACLIALCAGSADAAVTVECTVVTGPDLVRRAGRLAKLDGTTLQLASADGRQGVDLPLADVAWIDFNTSAPRTSNASPDAGGVPIQPRFRRGGRRAMPAAQPAEVTPALGGDFLLVLRDGERLRGTPAEIANDTLTFRTRSFGERKVPVAQIAGLTRTAATDDLEAVAANLIGSAGRPAPTQDELRLSNGDALSGVVASADAAQLTVQSADGQSVPIDWANVRQVRLAVLPGTEAATAEPAGVAPTFILRTAAGDRVQCAAATLREDGALNVTLAGDAGGEGIVPATELRSLEHRAGRVTLLTSLAPAERTYEPYFPQASSETGTAIERQPPASVTVAGKTTRAFVMARPKSRITWTLPTGNEAATQFRTRYGVPDARRYANATVRIYLDDKPVHEKVGVTSGTLSDPVELPLNGAQRLTLEVDYGEAFDVQDDVVWFEPILVRNVPSAR